MTSFIVPFRSTVRDLLRARGSIPAYGFLPDDVSHLPCHVVGRPSVVESGTPAVMTLTLDVTLLGRLISDEDSQAELDALADQLFEILGGTRLVRVDNSAIRCSAVLPGTVFVAGVEYPAYMATVSADIISC